MMKKLSVRQKENLEWMANKSIDRYIAMAVIGCILLTIGAVLFSTAFGLLIEIKQVGKESVISLKNFTPLTLGLSISGLILMCGPGTALAGVGVPCWIALGIQIKVARNKLNKLK